MDIDILYTMKHDKQNNSEELRYSLRSLKNIPHRRVFIVGEKPDWVMNVVYIPVPQNMTKYENVRKNIISAISDSRLGDNFILMNDDIFIMKKIDKLPCMNFGLMDDVIRLYECRYPEGSCYIDRLKLHNQIIKNSGVKNPICYELHTPMLFNKHKMLDMYRTVDNIDVELPRSCYGNLYDIGGACCGDVKIFLEPKHNPPLYNSDPKKYLDGQSFVSATGGAFKNGYPGSYIRDKFPKKSIYER